ncbi:MAG: helix-turn-helix transcriptional regulator [Bacteroidales bacterium]|nr:helix-turn-helix transcriptional regulator [Bacteroidales bacterium]
MRDITRQDLERRIGKAISFIDQNLNRNIDIRDIARAACLSEFHFIRTFNEFCGFTPYQYMIKRRIAKAKKLLLKEEFSVEEISSACGYESVHTFRKCFKRETGFSLREFERSQMAVA